MIAQATILIASVAGWWIGPATGVALAGWAALHVASVRLRGRFARVAAGLTGLAAGGACLLALAQAAGAEVLLATDWPIWPIALGTAGAAELCVRLYRFERRSVSRSAGVAMTAARVGVVVLALSLLTQPVRSMRRTERITRHVLVLVDRSASMTLPDAEPEPPGDDANKPPRPGPTRLAAALAGLTDEHDAGASLLATLEDRYAVDAMSFAETVQPIEADRLRASPTMLLAAPAGGEAGQRADAADANRPAPQAPAAPNGPAEPGAPGSIAEPDGHEATAFTIAMGEAARAVEERIVSGVLVLTDGRDTSGDVFAARKAGRGLARRGVPVCTLLVGSPTPPPDAGIVSIDAPEAIFVGDSVTVEARVKLDGLAGRTARVRLLDGEREAASTELTVRGPSLRTTVRLTDTPEGAGMRRYRVVVDGFDGEAFAANNEVPVPVAVRDDQAVVLLIDARPRWEYRYIKNLFADRDRSVRLQHVLLEPDRVAGADDRPIVHASADRAGDEVEATALPENVGAWLKFDVVILGDVAPEALDADAREGLRRFVADRGGTLVLIAGPRHMPAAYTGDELAELMPVEPVPSGRLAARVRRLRSRYAGGGRRRLDPRRSAGGGEATGDDAPPGKATRQEDAARGDTPPPGETPTEGDNAPAGDAPAERQSPQNGEPRTGADARRLANLPVSSPEEAFRIGVDDRSPLTRLDDDPQENARIWEQVPSLHWRHPLGPVKPAGEVLAWAVRPDVPDWLSRGAGSLGPSGLPRQGPPAGAGEEPLSRDGRVLRTDLRQRQYRRDHPLMVRAAQGAGQVLLLGTDRTWRLRYRVGDRHHHALWGGIVRWATATKLPAGTEHVRLGTDAWTYRPDQPIRIRARLLDANHVAIAAGPVVAAIYRGDRLIRRVTLQPDQPAAPSPADRPGEDASGRLTYEAALPPLPAGDYRVVLDMPEVEELFGAEAPASVETRFAVAPAARAELADLTADPSLPNELAETTGGLVARPGDAASLLEAMGPPSETLHRRRDVRLWDVWPVLASLLALACVEWIVRKKAGLP